MRDVSNLPALIPASTVDHFGGQQRIDLVRDQIAKGTSDGEFALFLAVCERTGLDPFARQIYAIVRGGRMTIQTSIDGYRAVADRHPGYAGSDRPVLEYTPDGKLNCAVVTVHKAMPDGRIVDYVGEAYWDEFNQGQGNWKTMPRVMLSKCAEAQALRKAFPSQLAGVYTHDEMAQADADQDPWRPYRNELIARARALPDEARAALRATGIDPRRCTVEELAEFERDLTAAEDEHPVEAVIVDDGPVPDPASAAGDGQGGGPAGPPPTHSQLERGAAYSVEKAEKRAARATVKRTPIEETLDAARYDSSTLDLATRAGA